MSMHCPKCGLSCDENAAYCHWCGADLRAEAGAGAPSVDSGQPVGPSPPPPPGPGAAWAPPPGFPPSPASGSPSSSTPGYPPPPASGLPPPPAPDYATAFGGPPAYPYGNLPPSVPTHLVWAILSTILCCLPLGIVSIAYAAQVNTHLFRGDIAGAQRSSRLARNWAIGSIGVGVAIWLGWIIYLIVVAGTGLGSLGRLRF
jgi:hypothetical protein